MSKRKDSISFSIERENHLKMKEVALKERRSLSQMMQLIVEEFLKKNEVA